MAEFADRVFCFYDMQGAGLNQRRGISEETAGRPHGRSSYEMATLVGQVEALIQRPSPPKPAVNPRRQELEIAQEILAEVFGALIPYVEMIRLRLEEGLERGGAIAGDISFALNGTLFCP